MKLDVTRILITVQMIDDTNELAYMLAIATGLFERIAFVFDYVSGWIRDVQEAAIVTSKLAAIIFVSVRFALQS